MKDICKLSVVCIVAVLMFSSCQSSRSGEVYSRDQARVSHSVYYGTILVVKMVQIEGTKSGAGVVAGGVLGGFLGNTIGGGTGRSLATAAGAIAGAAAGAVGEEAVTRTQGVELTVELDNGQIIAVVQEADDEYVVGDRVRILKGPDGTSRVRQ